MTVLINASNTSGLTITSDTSGNLAFQSNGTTVATVQPAGFSYPGAVVQLVSNTYNVSSGTISTTSSSTYSDLLSVSITPKFSTSKIYLSFTGTFNCTQNGVMFCAFDRNGTTLNVDNLGGIYYGAGTNIIETGQTYQYIDTPATTSAITYKMKMKAQNNGATVVFNANWGGSAGLAGIITAMEIAV